MKTKLRILALLLVALATAGAQSDDEEEAWPDAFSRHLKGTIGDKLQVEMQIQSIPGTAIFFSQDRQIRGQYWYAGKRVPIDLFGSETEFGILKLDEQTYAGGEKGWKTTGTFEGEMKQNGIFAGTWTSGDGKRKLPFKLARFEPDGSAKLKAHALESSWHERTSEGAAGLEHSAFILQVAGDSPAAKKLNQVLLKRAAAYFEEVDDTDQVGDEKDKPTTKKAKKLLTLDAVSKIILAERDEDLMANHETWSASCTAGVELNEHGLLCISHLFSAYTGGAHPNSVTEYLKFDSKTGAELSLHQLFKPGFLEALPKLATEKYRKLEGAGSKDDPGPTVESVNFDEGEAGWFINPAGFVIHFDPYAIAAYARGNVDLLIPWDELETWLTPGSPLRALLTRKK